ncbi:piggyBac transposable element-derived protein 3-like [Leptopilina heterotoma]|uniref:piggyBac transposable element-derived protein 3-like n=1 Tax=Leptopilina heterotoma TaxID=63436 RepID=UPI001CA9CBEE|nr:piggyBac transposable element-derived protein 3-like [Leptopilina heterotoma]
MTVNRFGFLLSHLHRNDNAKEPKKRDHGYDKLYKLRPVLDKLGQTFIECWQPGEYQAIDETMIKFKFPNSLKQYCTAKPIKRGYKCWTRADESGCVCEFQEYTGKAVTAEKQLLAGVVKDLTRELAGGNHDGYFYFFTGVDVLLLPKEYQIFSCGTVRSNRSKLPKSKTKDSTVKKVTTNIKRHLQDCNGSSEWTKRLFTFHLTTMTPLKLQLSIVDRRKVLCKL